MTVDCTFPRVEHIAVVVLFDLNAALVFEFSQLSCAFLVHDLLQITTHCPVSLADLSQDISLVSLLCHRSLDHLFLKCTVLALNLTLHILAFILLHPISLSLLLLL